MMQSRLYFEAITCDVLVVRKSAYKKTYDKFWKHVTLTIQHQQDKLYQIFAPVLHINQKAGAAVIAASMHGFASCRKFKSPVTLTLTLDRVKVTSTYTVYVGLPAYPTM